MPLSHLAPLVVLTGAGISAESGVPTFRGPDGLWRNHRPRDLANAGAFERDPALVWQFYAWRRSLVAHCRPNLAHRLLADLESRVSPFHLVTQNVDGLHQAAGSRSAIELHGSLWSLRCTACDLCWEDRKVPMDDPVPHCPRCSALARPDIVWFNEDLQPSIVQAAWAAFESARTVLVVGTSAVVLPAAELPLVSKRAGAWLVEINPEPTPLSAHCDEVLRGPATEMVADWLARQDA
jgi:NAD-dependent deacetylase